MSSNDEWMNTRFKPLVEGEHKFGDVFESYKMFVGSGDRPRHLVYIGGSHDKNMIWRAVYGKLSDMWRETIKPHMCDGICQSVHLYKMRDGSERLYAWADDYKLIASKMVCWIDEKSVPDEVMNVVFGDKEVGDE